MTAVVIALGSNLDDRLGNLRAALRELAAEGVTIGRTSSVWETDPYPPGQPEYLNAVVTAETALAPHDLLHALKAIEARLGRTETYRWGPRVIDLDILFYGDRHIDTPDLTIPHPRIGERAFVLAPLTDVVETPLPVLARTAAELLGETGSDGVRRTALTLVG